MKKSILFVSLCLGLSTIMLAQEQSENLDCERICTVEKTLYHDAYLGVHFGSPCDKDSEQDKGVIILKVLPKTPAAKATLQAKDLVLMIDDVEVNGRGAVINAIKRYQPFDVVKLTIKSKGKVMIKEVMLGAKNTSIVEEQVCCEDVNDTLNADNVSVFPNPTVSKLNIAFRSVVQTDYTFEVFMVNGVLVKTYTKTFKDGVFSETIDVSKMEYGSYILKVSNGTEYYTKLFVIGE